MDELHKIKGYHTQKFEVELFQDNEGRYVVRYEYGGEETYSEWITDYHTASYIFDLKVHELEGN